MDDRIEINQELEARLVEWSRWARLRRWASFCRSVEGRYRAPAGDVWETTPKPDSSGLGAFAVRILKAWEVECAWRTSLDFRERCLVRAVWITAPKGSSQAWEAHKRRTCRELGIRAYDFASTVVRSAMLIERALLREQFRITIRAKSLHPPHGQMRADTATLGGVGVYKNR